MENSASRIVMGEGLDQYISVADDTQRTLIERNDDLLKALNHYDEYFRKGLLAHVNAAPQVSIILFMNTYQIYLAAIRMALSGHTAAVFPLLRTALESASYGYLIETQSDLGDIWVHRHKSPGDLKACRKHFTFDKAISGLKSISPELHGLAKEVYDGAIDFGAHPNVKGVIGHISFDMERDDGMVGVTHTSLYGPDHVETLRGLVACLDFGYVIIAIVALSGSKDYGKLQAELAYLGDVKEAAIEPYRSPE